MGEKCLMCVWLDFRCAKYFSIKLETSFLHPFLHIPRHTHVSFIRMLVVLTFFIDHSHSYQVYVCCVCVCVCVSGTCQLNASPIVHSEREREQNNIWIVKKSTNVKELKLNCVHSFSMCFLVNDFSSSPFHISLFDFLVFLLASLLMLYIYFLRFACFDFKLLLLLLLKQLRRKVFLALV